jgi:hypothetical protein
MPIVGTAELLDLQHTLERFEFNHTRQHFAATAVIY